MRVNIFARPDHSVHLFKGLNSIGFGDISYYTFFAARHGSMLNTLLPTRKSVPAQAKTLDAFTLLAYSSSMVGKKIGLNTMLLQQKLCELMLPKRALSSCDVLHYWPFYCPRFARSIKENSGIKTVAEFYEAEPSFVNDLCDREYAKYGVSGRRINTLINQNEAFEFEDNFIVASEYTKSTYLKLYPDANIHVCSYGPLNYSLAPGSLAKVESSASKKTKRIIFVGQVCLEKGVHILIEACSALRVSLTLVGPIRSGQEALFSKILSGNTWVTHLGGMRNSEVLSILSEYDIFSLPSFSDNYSLAVNEALSCGLPVLVTDNCGNKDDIVNFRLGSVSKTGDVEDLMANIDAMIRRFDYETFHAGLVDFFSDENRLQYPKSVVSVYNGL